MTTIGKMRAKRNIISSLCENNKYLICTGGIKGSVEVNWTHVLDRAYGCVRLYGHKAIWNYLNVPRISLSFIERSVLLQSNFIDRSLRLLQRMHGLEIFHDYCACMDLANQLLKEEKKQ